MDDGLGSLLGSRTCPWGITIADITLERIHVANLPGNTINALIKIGTYGPPDDSHAERSNLDRWYFCSNSWWRDGQTFQTGEGITAARFERLKFVDWDVQVVPASGECWLYNFYPHATTAFHSFTHMLQSDPDRRYHTIVRIGDVSFS